MFNKYYQEELLYLRELGREFSQAFPALAPMLADRGADPDVERLLEGVAFLTGRIRQKLDDEIPEIVVAIASLLFPHLVRPLPSTTILELTSIAHAARESARIPIGAEFLSIEVDGTPCRFRSTAPCDIWPITIEDVRLESLPAGKQQLRIELALTPGTNIEALLSSPMRFHLAGDVHDALRMLSWLMVETEDVSVIESRPSGGGEREISLGRTALSPVGFSEDEPLLSMGRVAFPGFRLLEEYYVLPQKFAFFEVRDVARVAAFGPDTKRFALVLRFGRRMPDAAPITRESVKLHCVPIINLFETTADPIRLAPNRERFLVRTAGLAPKAGEVYSIERVEAIERGRGHRVEIPCFYDFSHRASGTGFFYTPHYSPSVVGDGVDVSVSFGTPEDSQELPDAEVASLQLLATNRALASRLRPGEIRVPTAATPSGVVFRNLYPTTPHVSPPFGRELHWRVVAHAAMGIRSLTEPEVLRSVLDVYNLKAIVDRQVARAHELRLAALKDVKVSASERLYRGALVRGVQIDVFLDETGFAGEGDLYLFGAILESFFAHYVSLNSFAKTTIHGQNSKVRFTWPARSGNQTML